MVGTALAKQPAAAVFAHHYRSGTGSRYRGSLPNYVRNNSALGVMADGEFIMDRIFDCHYAI